MMKTLEDAKAAKVLLERKITDLLREFEKDFEGSYLANFQIIRSEKKGFARVELTVSL